VEHETGRPQPRRVREPTTVGAAIVHVTTGGARYASGQTLRASGGIAMRWQQNHDQWIGAIAPARAALLTPTLTDPEQE